MLAGVPLWNYQEIKNLVGIDIRNHSHNENIYLNETKSVLPIIICKFFPYDEEKTWFGNYFDGKVF